MVINFRTRRISRGTYKLTQTPTLINKKTYTNIIAVFNKINQNYVLINYYKYFYFKY